jgi:starch synthase
MYSLAYGTAPVVRKTGGLADTVTHFDTETGEGNGFVFEHHNAQGLAWALGQALEVHTDKGAWQQLQRNAMAVDNSWTMRAGQYVDVYRRLIG